MAVARFPLPEVVDLSSASALAEGLTRHIRSSRAPVVVDTKLARAGVPLLQILVAGRRLAESLGKTLVVKATPGGPLTQLFETFGLDPALCGAAQGQQANDAATHLKGTGT